MNCKNTTILTTFLILFSTIISFGENKTFRNPITELKINGFENQDIALITSIFYATGWFTSANWSQKTQNHGIDISVYINRRSVDWVEIKLKKKREKEISLKHDIRGLYGRKLASNIINAIGNELFGEKQFNSLASSKIIFSAQGENKHRNIYTIEINGEKLSKKTYRGKSSNPIWEKSKKYIFYNTEGDINTSLIIKDFNNNKHRLFSYFNGINSQVTANPKGKEIVLCLDINGTIDIGIMKIESNDFSVTSLTNDKDIEFSPTWSPNGSNICFSASKIKDGILTLPKLKIINIATKETKNLFPQSKFGYYDPTWNSKGLIAYSKKIKERFFIGYYDPIKNSKEIIINIENVKSGDWLHPNWAPDGRHLICINKNNDIKKLYIVDSWSNTAKEIPLTVTNIEDPSWSSFSVLSNEKTH